MKQSLRASVKSISTYECSCSQKPLEMHQSSKWCGVLELGKW
jgi:hypothetical protein